MAKLDWVDFYKEFANKLLDYRNNRDELIKKIKASYDNLSDINLPTLETGNDIEDIDPFTVFGLFNKSSLKETNRKLIINELAKTFDIKSPVPSTFDSIPTVNNQNATFYPFRGERTAGTFDVLWDLFEMAQKYAKNPSNANKQEVSRLFEAAIGIKYNANGKITAGLYWIAPESFLSVDTCNVQYIYESNQIPQEIVDTLPKAPKTTKLSAKDYFEIIDKLTKYLQSAESTLKNFTDLSSAAFQYSQKAGSLTSATETNGVTDTVTSDFTTPAARYAKILKSSYNVIFRGAPGTGKSYLAKSIAAYMVSENDTDGPKTDYKSLSDDEKKRIGFVQFHPSYDYSDFVEGLRPVKTASNEIVFDRKDGIFKEFVERAKSDAKHNYVFIIDEINRGEISKILGELFFSIDPGYRGEEGSVFTQYSNMHNDKNEKFYIPENVYIIGTMNDIDRSVDTFDFAMRRRFRFIEIKADEHTDMLNNLEDDVLMEEAIRRMKALNAAITDTEGLNSNYHIGAAYFLKLKNLSGSSQDRFDALWTDYLEPLLQEYVNGMSTEKEELEKFKKAYTSKKYTSHKDGEDETEEENTDVATDEDDHSTGTDEG